jgi:hypothetical protein
MYRWLMVVMASAIVGAAGYVHGLRTDRWGESNELTQAVARIQSIPAQFGDWESQPNELDPRQLQIGEIAGYASRVFENRQTKERVSILLICGRPGPISVHTPDICYRGLGYSMGQRTLQTLNEGKPVHPPEFWLARFNKESAAPLNIAWAWNNGSRWLAPEHPRLSFYQSKYLYKLYVIRSVKSGEDTLLDETTREFMAQYLNVLKETLFLQPTASPS